MITRRKFNSDSGHSGQDRPHSGQYIGIIDRMERGQSILLFDHDRIYQDRTRCTTRSRRRCNRRRRSIYRYRSLQTFLFYRVTMLFALHGNREESSQEIIRQRRRCQGYRPRNRPRAISNYEYDIRERHFRYYTIPLQSRMRDRRRRCTGGQRCRGARHFGSRLLAGTGSNRRARSRSRQRGHAQQ